MAILIPSIERETMTCSLSSSGNGGDGGTTLHSWRGPSKQRLVCVCASKRIELIDRWRCFFFLVVVFVGIWTQEFSHVSCKRRSVDGGRPLLVSIRKPIQQTSKRRRSRRVWNDPSFTITNYSNVTSSMSFVAPPACLSLLQLDTCRSSVMVWKRGQHQACSIKTGRSMDWFSIRLAHGSNALLTILLLGETCIRGIESSINYSKRILQMEWQCWTRQDRPIKSRLESSWTWKFAIIL